MFGGRYIPFYFIFENDSDICLRVTDKLSDLTNLTQVKTIDFYTYDHYLRAMPTPSSPAKSRVNRCL